jgi:3-hydroxyacyl-CoA dehydrogenase
MAGARYEVRGSIAIIPMDNPPVNGLGYDNRLGLLMG